MLQLAVYNEQSTIKFHKQGDEFGSQSIVLMQFFGVSQKKLSIPAFISLQLAKVQK